MATTNCLCGFESGDQWQAIVTGGEYLNNSLAVSASAKRTGEYGAVATPSGAGLAYGTFSGWSSGLPIDLSGAAQYVRFYINPQTLPTDWEQIFYAFNGSNLKCSLEIGSTGTIRIKNQGASVVETGSYALSTGTWYRIELVVRNSTSGAYEVRIAVGDSVGIASTLSGSAFNFAANDMTSFALGKRTNVSSSGYTIWYDDVRCDTSGFPGPGGIIRLDPDAVGQDAQWTASGGGAAAVADVDAIPWADGNYCKASTLNYYQTFDLESCATAGISGTIGAAMALTWARSAGSAGSIGVRTRGTGSYVSDAGPSSYNGGWRAFGAIFNDEPGNPGTALTTTILDSVEVGMYITTGVEMRFGGVMLQVDFTTAATGLSKPKIMHYYRSRSKA